MVGTPGRLDDLISTGKLSLSEVRFLVLDECVCEFFLFFYRLHICFVLGFFMVDIYNIA